jgi:hypothetical protein
MAKASKSKRLERFSEEELNDFLNAPNLTGLRKALTFPVFDSTPEASPRPIVPFPAPPATIEQPAPEPLNITTPVITTLPETTPDAITPAVTTPVESTRDITTRVETTPVVLADLPAYVPPPRPCIVHRCQLAQDGHSRSEQSLYETLWKLGKPTQPDDAFRYVRISMKTLAELPAVRMTPKNLRIALQRLIEKLTLEEAQTFDPQSKAPRVWKVYSYKLILERRRAAGMEWVVRDRGVRFVDRPETTPVRTTPVDIQNNPGCYDQITPDVMNNNPGQNSLSSPVVMTPASLLGNLSLDEPSSSDVTELRRRLEEIVGTIDQESVGFLWKECRARAGDCTPEEIAYFSQLKLQAVKGIRNPVGVLRGMVPKHFENGGHLPVREILHQQREKELQRRREICQYLRDMIANPSTSAEDLEYARQDLARVEAEL